MLSTLLVVGVISHLWCAARLVGIAHHSFYSVVVLLHMKLIIAPQKSSSIITVPRTIIKSFQSTGHPSGAELYFWLLYSLKQKREIYESCNNNICNKLPLLLRAAPPLETSPEEKETASEKHKNNPGSDVHIKSVYQRIQFYWNPGKILRMRERLVPGTFSLPARSRA